MSIVLEQDFSSYFDSGLWGTRSLDTLLQVQSKRLPDKIALSDIPLRDSFLQTPARSLTYLQLNNAVERVARLFLKMGLKKNNLICICLPNCVENIVTVMAAWRAGLIVVPISHYWRVYEFNIVMHLLQIDAVITMSNIGSYSHASLIRYVARDNFSVRFVFGFCSPLPDGVISLDELLDDDYDSSELESVELPASNANDIAAITFSVSGHGAPTPIARTHNHILASGISCYVEAGVLGGENIISCLSLTSITGFATSIVPWLLSAGKLVLCPYFDPESFVETIVEEKINFACLPFELVSIIDDLKNTSLRGVWASWQRLLPDNQQKPLKSLATVVDVHNFAEYGLYAAKRQGFEPLPLNIEIKFPSYSDNKSLALSLSLKPHSYISDRENSFSHSISCFGAQTPLIGFERQPPFLKASHTLRTRFNAGCKDYETDENGFAATGLLCNLDKVNGNNYIKNYSYNDNVVFYGNIPISVSDIEKVYSDYSQAESVVALELSSSDFGSKIAIVMQVGNIEEFNQSLLNHHLQRCSVAPYKIVDSVYVVNNLPISSNNRVDRRALYNDLLNKRDTYHPLTTIKKKIS